MINPEADIELDQLIFEAARLAKFAGVTCRKWERGGLPEAVGDTAVAAIDISQRVIRMAEKHCGEPQIGKTPETRRGRLLAAAWLMVVAGTDEHGESFDLAIASKLFCKAAAA